MLKGVAIALIMACALARSAAAENSKSFDAAAAFGAREAVHDLTLSPDGKSVAYIAPIPGRGSQLITWNLERGVKLKAMQSDGNPFRILSCSWVSNSRLVCEVYAILRNPRMGLYALSRLVALDADGKNLKLLSTRENDYSRQVQLWGGGIIDWLPNEDGAVLIARKHLADDRLGTRLGSSEHGLAVDWLDTRTLRSKPVERADENAADYISDGRGTVRVMALSTNVSASGISSGTYQYLYRKRGSRDWHELSNFNSVDGTGFKPEAVDPDLNVAYGFKKKDGRFALYSVKLDESLAETLVFERPDVDVSGLARIGRQQRVVGASYITEAAHTEYFDPAVEKVRTALSKALRGLPIHIAEADVNEDRLLIHGIADTDPGIYYLFDGKTHQLNTILPNRPDLEGIPLASVHAVSYPAEDGTRIPAYLTLPPGRESAKGLPAIVLPHGGPYSRDVWGFDWLPQFFASRGYAVLQPNFRGSAGFGDAWLVNNGFKSWPTAIGDIRAGGRFLVQEGVEPSKLAIVGWSYGGYAALQSAVVDQTLFKAVVAIAPVTDLSAAKDEWHEWTNYKLVRNEIGDGPEMHAGSPIEHADKIKVPVLLFHADMDRNVSIEQSRRMAARLTAVGAHCELVTWEGLDHQIEDSGAREEMLRKSDEFLRRALGL